MIVLDTSFLVGLYNRQDAHHTTAREQQAAFLAKRWGTGLLLEYVLLETVNVVLNRCGLTAAAEIARTLLCAADVEFVACSVRFADTVQAFTVQATTRLSFTDIAIAQLARERAEGRVLSFDQEFHKLPDLCILPS